MYDQVLIRPALLKHFKNEDLKILHTDGLLPLVDADGLPNRKEFSDHLPILLRLHL